MVVLSIIGVVIVLFIVYRFIQYSNRHSLKKYNYEIFNVGTFFLSVLGYVALFFGYSWYGDALQDHTDILNGELVIGIGILLLYSVIYFNVNRTSLFYGLIMSIVTGAFYLVATPFILAVIVMGVAYFSQTKPVFNVND